MTEQDVLDAISTLGIDLVPPVAVGENVQYSCRSDPTASHRGSVTIGECVILAEWADGKSVLEIGTGVGVSTVCMASTATTVATVDPDEWVRSNLVLPPNVSRFASIDEVGGTFDFAFIDGLHDTDSVTADIIECRKRVKPGGFIGLHDMGQIGVIAAVGLFEWASRKEYATLGTLTFCEVPA